MQNFGHTAGRCIGYLLHITNTKHVEVLDSLPTQRNKIVKISNQPAFERNVGGKQKQLAYGRHQVTSTDPTPQYKTRNSTTSQSSEVFRCENSGGNAQHNCDAESLSSGNKSSHPDIDEHVLGYYPLPKGCRIETARNEDQHGRDSCSTTPWNEYSEPNDDDLAVTEHPLPEGCHINKTFIDIEETRPQTTRRTLSSPPCFGIYPSQVTDCYGNDQERTSLFRQAASSATRPRSPHSPTHVNKKDEHKHLQSILHGA